MNLHENAVVAHQKGTLHSTSSTQEWFWVKAHTMDNENVMTMSCAMTCKDHMIDGYMNYRTHAYSKGDWTQAQQNENAIVVIVPTNQTKLLVKNIKDVLNPYEKKHRLQKTTCTLLTNNLIARNCYLIKGSQMWMRNATAWSLYLTLIRLCGQTKDMLSLDGAFMGTNPIRNNDRVYFSNLPPEEKTLYLSYVNNPRQFLVKLPNTHQNSTAPKEMHLPHGGAGLHYMITNVAQVQANCMRGRTTKAQMFDYYIRGYFYAKVHEDLIIAKNIDISLFKEVRTNEW